MEEIYPTNYLDVCDNDLFHHSDKGCDIEITETQLGDSVLVGKYCKTHKVKCSKSGWESGWYNGTNSHIMSKEIECASCGVSIITSSSHRTLCDKCIKETADFRTFLYANYRKLVVYNKPVSREVLEYMKIRYDEEFNPYIKLLNYNIKKMYGKNC